MCQFCKNKGYPYNIWTSHRIFNCTDPTNPQGKNFKGPTANNINNSNQPKTCKVMGCDGRHPGGHYCRNCGNSDSDHWSKDCSNNLPSKDCSNLPSKDCSNNLPSKDYSNNNDQMDKDNDQMDKDNDQTDKDNDQVDQINPNASLIVDDEWNSDIYDPAVVKESTGLDKRYEEKKSALVFLAKCNRKWFSYLMQNSKIPKPFTQKAILTPTKDTGKLDGIIILTQMKTDEAILMYRDEGTICIWNCGSGQKPLGGYMAGHGQRAQEEDVARKSTLSSALIDAKSGGLYPINDGVLYTIGLTLLRTGPQFQKLDEEKWTDFSAITSAAPNMQGYFKGKTFQDVRDTIEEKIEKMFVVPEEEILIGAGWGCGSFAPSKDLRSPGIENSSKDHPQNHADYINSIATTIAKHLGNNQHRYKKIVFTLPDPDIYKVFEQKFQEFDLI